MSAIERPRRKSPAKSCKKSPAKKAAKKSPAKKAAKKSPAKKAARKSPAKKAARKSPAKKAAKKSPAKKSPAKKAARKSPAKKSPAKKSPRKTPSPRRSREFEHEHYFKAGNNLTEAEKKYCALVAHLHGKNERGESDISNVYAVAAKAIGTTSRDCGNNYNFDNIPVEETLGLAKHWGVTIPKGKQNSAKFKKELLENIHEWKTHEYEGKGGRYGGMGCGCQPLDEEKSCGGSNHEEAEDSGAGRYYPHPESRTLKELQEEAREYGIAYEGMDRDTLIGHILQAREASEAKGGRDDNEDSGSGRYLPPVRSRTLRELQAEAKEYGIAYEDMDRDTLISHILQAREQPEAKGGRDDEDSGSGRYLPPVRSRTLRELQEEAKEYGIAYEGMDRDTLISHILQARENIASDSGGHDHKEHHHYRTRSHNYW